MSKDYFKRYIWLIDLISGHGYISFNEINEAWKRSSLNERPGSPYSERSFHHHRRAVEDMFGIEIKNDRSLGYYIANPEQINESGAMSWLLQSISISNIVSESRDLRERILFEEVPSAQMHLSAIINAMRDGKVLRMTYRSFRREDAHTFLAEPLCVKQFRQRWYMLAKSGEHEGGFRTYCLDDRLIDLEETDMRFTLPEDFDAEGYFNDFFGIITNGKICRVVLKVRADQVSYYRSLPLHHSQEETETHDAYSIFCYRLAATFDFWQEMMSKGDTVEVLEPESLREWMASTAEKMDRIYNG